ncbi:MAG TPA: hypothetical protein VIY90_06340 [Steroidobacteraceae bacterium]
MRIGTLDMLKSFKKPLPVYQTKVRDTSREGKVFLAPCAKFTHHKIVWRHAPPRYSVHLDGDRSRHPVPRRVGGGSGSHALGVVAVLEIKITGFPEHERDLVRETLIILGRYDINIACSSEFTLRRVWQHGQNGGRPNDEDLPEAEAPPDLEYDVLQLASVHACLGCAY